jgi:hypothetical protein
MVEPKGYINTASMLTVTVVTVLLMLLIHLGIGMTQSQTTVLSSSYDLVDTASTSSFVTEPFTLTKWHSNLEFEIIAEVDNDWFEMSASLVNTKTNEEYAVTQGVEYYHGYEDGESWTEGSKMERAYLSSIPAGTYFLRIEGTRPAGAAANGSFPLSSTNNKINTFLLKVTNDVPMDRNLFIFLVPLLIWPAIKLYMINNAERSRWSNSNFSPFNQDNE